jgi:prepilin-type N-terminal cleavage/methylation domain-containing protein
MAMKWSEERVLRRDRLPSNTMAARRGFTLIEILLVMVIIAVLSAIVIGGARYVKSLSRDRNYEITRLTLKTALVRYHGEYNAWPLGGQDASQPIEGDNNKYVFHMLREENNPKGIRFLEETALLTLHNGQRTPLNRAPADQEAPLIYIDGKSGEVRYFTVTFDLDNETVKVY